MNINNRLRHFFHVVSNVRPIIWIGLYIVLIPIFGLFYHWLPDSQFRIPDGGTVDYGSWLYYSIVTITTLGFGDYTPVGAAAQAFTAIEVGCGLLIIGFFLNAVGSMKSEIDIDTELEKQRQVHDAQEKDKLLKSIPMIIHNINLFLAYCYAVTTPQSKRDTTQPEYNPDFTFADMADLYKPSGLSIDHTKAPAVEGLLKATARTALCIDSMQNRVDLTLWPQLLEDSFSFVADYQMFSSSDALAERIESRIHEGKDIAPTAAEKTISQEITGYTGPLDTTGDSRLIPYFDLYDFIKKSASAARSIEIQLSQIASQA